MTFMHPFDRTGFAALRDLESDEWRNINSYLEQVQSQFLSKEESFRSPEYRWPRDPLHTWSRVWEYPYVYFHLAKIRNEVAEERLLTVADYGSGVTFFPFTAARLGYDVTCIDVDPICAHDIPKAAAVVDSGSGKIDVSLLKGDCIQLQSNSQDVVYCISVLEHVSNLEHTIIEISRVLKPGGILILTVDVDLRGNAELGVDEFMRLQKYLMDRFETPLREIAVHPSDHLNVYAGIYQKPR
jgi:SAM-dependent methyltransferase